MEYQEQLLNTYPPKEWEDLCIKIHADNSKTAAIAWCSNSKKKEPIVVDIPEDIHLGPYATSKTACKKCNRSDIPIYISGATAELYEFKIPNRQQLKGL